MQEKFYVWVQQRREEQLSDLKALKELGLMNPDYYEALGKYKAYQEMSDFLETLNGKEEPT